MKNKLKLVEEVMSATKTGELEWEKVLDCDDRERFIGYLNGEKVYYQRTIAATKNYVFISFGFIYKKCRIVLGNSKVKDADRMAVIEALHNLGILLSPDTPIPPEPKRSLLDTIIIKIIKRFEKPIDIS